MMDNDNTVNIDAQPRAYHHGNLRESLIRAGLEALETSDADGLSLREVARTVGVSATSVYRHFPDKQAFVAALCAEGSHRLALAQRAAMTGAGGPQSGLDASGLAYVRFALAHPGLFRLMTRTRTEDLAAGGSETPAMRELRVNVAAVLPSEATGRQHEIRALRAWAIVHGVTMLILDGRLPADEDLIRSIIQTTEV